MDDVIYEKYKRAGRAAAEAREKGISLLKTGVRFVEVATKIESVIIKKGIGLAFPVNISVNHLAAHYSPRTNDPLIIKKGDLVKLDVGAQIDGFIADTAVTVEVATQNSTKMIAASSEALENAIHLMKAGVDLTHIGKRIEDTITSYGFRPIDNLTGHSMEQYVLHSGISVPNIAQSSPSSTPKKGTVLAIEPFATNGAGHVITGEGSNIYLCKEPRLPRLLRDNKMKIMYQKLRTTFKTLPFAQRWVHHLFPDENTDLLLKKLTFYGLVKHYPQLVESKSGLVTQKEHTIIITENGCEVIT